MIDREKVIRALSECSSENNAMCDKCPYNGSKGICIANMASDALALLKEQENLLGIHQTADGITFISTGIAQEGESRGISF